VDEKQAVERLRRGDPAGLEALVRLYQVQAVRAACLIAGDRALAEDIVQNAFIRAGERIGQFDARRPFGPWFLRGVVRDAIKAARRERRFIPLDPDDGGEPLNLADPAPLPEEAVEAAETIRAVRRALEQLSPNQRAAVVLRYYLGMSEDEMTIRMQSRTGTVKWRLHAARKNLGRLLHLFRPSEPPSTPDRRTESGKTDLSGDLP
jgi:RNA polymerase sigma-70 factor (ECF subfamily)